MCYCGCKYESTYYGPNMGECRKPKGATCPMDLVQCENCKELFEEEELDADELCEECADEKLEEAWEAAQQPGPYDFDDLKHFKEEAKKLK